MTNKRYAVLFLGVVAVLGLLSVTYLAGASERPIPDVLVALPSGAVGSLGTLLTVRGGRRRRAKRVAGEHRAEPVEDAAH